MEHKSYYQVEEERVRKLAKSKVRKKQVSVVSWKPREGLLQERQLNGST